MSTDTRPALTVRWRELERRGWVFRLHTRPHDVNVCELIGERNGEVYVGHGMRRPIGEFWEEDAVLTFEYWGHRDFHD